MALIILSFAGGSSYSFESIKKIMKCPVYIIEYPGRGKKISGKLLYDSEQLINNIYAEFSAYTTAPYAIYGHSMGTLIGYLLIKKIKEENKSLPLHLFVSGRGGPSNPIDEIKYNLPKAEFWKTIKELGGSPEAVLNNQELMDFFEPILRADFQVIETYKYQESNPFDVPVTVLLGKEDKVTDEQAMLWQKETTMPIDIKYFDGGHFFIIDNAKEIVDIITEKLNGN